MKASIDRIEGQWVVLCIDGHEERRPRSSISAAAREGDVIDLVTGQVDAEATAALRREVEAAREQAMKGKTQPPGDFEL